jgi:hypothetical protein
MRPAFKVQNHGYVRARGERRHGIARDGAGFGWLKREVTGDEERGTTARH